MISITIQGSEFYDEKSEEFSTVGDVVLEFEHSLISLSKWESKFQKPFLGKETKTAQEVFEYILCMLITPDVDEAVFSRFTKEHFDMINAYIDSPQSATTFGSLPETKRSIGETITAELIYYWMIALNIPFECEVWHLNRLFALIRICNVKSGKPKKVSKSALAKRNHDLNMARREALGSSG